jgi:fatty acid synthase
VVPVHAYKEVGIIQSGGIELRGVKASAIARRRPLGVPVLEKYVFVPNVEPPSLDLHTALRVCIHIILENQLSNHVKAVELPHHERIPLSPTLAVILGDLPLIQASFQLMFRGSLLEQLEFIITPTVSFKLLSVGFVVDSVIKIIHECQHIETKLKPRPGDYTYI